MKQTNGSKAAECEEFWVTSAIVPALRSFGPELERLASYRSKDGPEERQRYILILMRTAKFLKEIGAPAAVTNPYYKMALELDDLEMGQTSAALERVRCKGTPPDPSMIWLHRRRVALGVVAVIECGKKTGPAAQHVSSRIAKAVDKLRIRSLKGDRAGVIKDWFEQFSDKAVPNEMAQDGFAELADLMKARVIMQPEERRLIEANRILDEIASHITAD